MKLASKLKPLLTKAHFQESREYERVSPSQSLRAGYPIPEENELSPYPLGDVYATRTAANIR